MTSPQEAGEKSVASPAATRYRIVIAVILFITLMVSYLDRTNVSILSADPKFQQEMGVVGQASQLGLLLTVFLLAYGVGNIITAPLGNLLGARKAMALAIVVWMVSVILGGMAGSFLLILATRVVLGLGEGLHWPMQSLFVTNWFPLRERGKANSAWLVGLMVGPMLGNPLITWIIGGQGWRASFWWLAAFSLIPLSLVWFFTRDTPEESPHANEAEVRYIRDNSGTKTTQIEGEHAGGRWHFLTDWRYWLIVLAFTASASMFWGTVAWLPSYLKVARGFTWAQMGLLSSLPYLLGAITVLVFGAIADRYAKKGIFPTIALTGAAVSIFSAANVSDNMSSALLMSLALAFIGVGLSCYWTMMQGLVQRSSVGQAAGVMNGVSQFASAFIPTIMGAIVGTATAAGNWYGALVTLAGVGLVGAILMLILTVKRV